MKNREKNRVFLCFRPVVVDAPFKSHGEKGFGDPFVTYIAVKDQGDNIMVPAILSPLPEEEHLRKSRFSLQRGSPGRGRKKSVSRILSRIARVVLFETKLTKKIRNRRVRHDPCRPAERTERKSVNADSESGRGLSKVEDRKIEPTVSSLSSSSSSSSFSSSSSSNPSSTSLSERNKSSEPKRIRNQSDTSKQSKSKRVPPENHNSGLHLLLVSFVSLIFFGRLYAILWTATWLYLIPSRRSNDESRPATKTPATTDSRDCRKRVVMEGFLDRNHSRV